MHTPTPDRKCLVYVAYARREELAGAYIVRSITVTEEAAKIRKGRRRASPVPTFRSVDLHIEGMVPTPRHFRRLGRENGSPIRVVVPGVCELSGVFVLTAMEAGADSVEYYLSSSGACTLHGLQEGK